MVAAACHYRRLPVTPLPPPFDRRDDDISWRADVLMPDAACFTPASMPDFSAATRRAACRYC